MRWSELPTPCYVVDEALLQRNLKILQGVMGRTGAHILLAQKAFSMYALYPEIGKVLCGATASGLYEARLCAEEMVRPLAEQGKKCENHIFSPAYREEDFAEILEYCDHIVFNSWKQVEKFGARAKAAGKSIGLRINPECSTQEGHAIYDPCAPGSRLGTTKEEFETCLKSENGCSDKLLALLDGIHFHTLCEQDSDDLEKTLDAVEEKFGAYLSRMKWINFGGGHHITREGYDIFRLEKCIRRMQEKYGLEVYLEPGEAVALNAGFLITSVLETRDTKWTLSGLTDESAKSKEAGLGASSGREGSQLTDIDKCRDAFRLAILDTSAACHMPDVLEMPYRPPLQDSGLPGERPFTYRLGGPTCLAGDIIGDYSFDKPLKAGDRLVFEDMAIYSMVKNNTFNGMALPAIALKDKNGECRIVKQFSYEDFKRRI